MDVKGAKIGPPPASALRLYQSITVRASSSQSGVFGRLLGLSESILLPKGEDCGEGWHMRQIVGALGIFA
jgi:hypothetical protein